MSEITQHMTTGQLILTAATQALLLLAVLVSVAVTHRCFREDKRRSWRLLGLSRWLVLGFVVSLIETAVVIIGCPPLPVMRILLWLDRTVLFIGYLTIALTSWQLMKLYHKRQGK